MNPNECIDPLAAKAWLEGKSVDLYALSHPLRDEVFARLMEHLEGMILSPQEVLNWRPLSGGQPGAQQLIERFPKAKHHFWQETKRATQAVKASHAPEGWASQLKKAMGLSLQGDFSIASVDAQSPLFKPVDLICSSLALHNEADPSQVINTWSHLLRPQGVVLFSCWGPDTLKELRSLYTQCGWPEPMHPLVDMHNWGDLLVQNGLSDPVMDMEYLTLTYDKTETLVSDLRFLGRNLTPVRRPGLLSRVWKEAWTQALENERLRQGGRIQLSFEVIYGHAFKAQPKKAPSTETQISLEEMRSRLKKKSNP